MSEESLKNITDNRLIAGYLRDAIFNSAVFIFRFEHLVFNAYLVNINEKFARDKDCERSLEFTVATEADIPNFHLEYGATIVFEVAVALDRLLLKFKISILKNHGKNIVTTLPVEAIAVSERKNFRFKASHLSPKACIVSISQKNGSKLFGNLEILDISGDGVGALLTVSEHTVLMLPATIGGKLLQHCGSIPLDGEIFRLEKKQTEQSNTYQVGIRTGNNFEQSEKIDRSTEERRIRPRLRVELLIEVVSPLMPSANIVLQLEDISLQGMRARFLNNADRELFCNSLELIVKSPRLRVKVQNISKKSITFKILRSALEEHIKLFNLQSFLSEVDLASRTPIASDIAQVYSTSGALSTPLAKSLSSNRSHILNSNIIQSADHPWYLRWLQQSESGRIRAAILTAPYSDHLWYLGGLAGHLDDELKMNEDFVERYFKSLFNFLESIGSKEYLLFNWFKTHSWWTEWDHYLSNEVERPDFFRFTADIIYLKKRVVLSPEMTDRSCSNLVEQGDVAEIERILNKIEPESIRRLFSAFGLSPFTFGAQSTAALLLKGGHFFKRNFYKIQIDNIEIVSMVSTFPDYIFLNGIINYPFVYSPIRLNARQLDTLSAILLKIGVANGIDVPAFFLTCAGFGLGFEGSESLMVREAIWTFGSSNALDYWVKK